MVSLDLNDFVTSLECKLGMHRSDNAAADNHNSSHGWITSLTHS